MEDTQGRLWFLFNEEKELGPFSEKEILEKIEKNEISLNAFAYTEGMSDWKAIKDIPVFRKTEIIGSSDTPKASDEVFTDVKENVQVQFTQKAKKQFPIGLSLFAAFAIAFSFLAVAMYFWDDNSKEFNFASIEKMLTGSSQTKKSFIKTNKVGDEKSTAQEDIAPKGVEVSSWDELLEFRKTSAGEHSNPSGFALSNTEFTNNFPTIQGAVGPHIKGDLIELALFPQKDQTLMVYPMTKFYKVPLMNGFFTLGPLNDDGKEFPAGNYKIMAKVNNIYLGEVKIQIGHWPNDIELAEKMKIIDRERSLLSEREKRTLQSRLDELVALRQKLNQYALNGSEEEAEHISSEWSKEFEKVAIEQQETLKNPIIFHRLHDQILTHLEKLNKLHQDLEDARLQANNIDNTDKEYLDALKNEIKVHEDKITNNLLAIRPIMDIKIPTPSEEQVRMKLMEGQ